MQNLSMFQMNSMFLNQPGGRAGGAMMPQGLGNDANGDAGGESKKIFQQLTVNEFPEFFMKTYEFFNQMSYGQSMHNQQIISNFQHDLQSYYYKNELFFDSAKLDQKIQATKVLRFKDFKDWDFVIL